MFWKLFSLISVSIAFLTLVVWVYLPRNKSRFDEYRSIPLQEDSVTSQKNVSKGDTQ